MSYDKQNQKDLYPPSHVVYESGKQVRTLCQRCGVTVRTIATGELTAPSGLQFGSVEMIDLPNFSRGEAIPIISGGVRSSFQPILCTECEGKELDKEKIIRQLMNGWEQEKIASGMEEEEAAAWVNKYSFTEVIKEGV